MTTGGANLGNSDWIDCGRKKESTEFLLPRPVNNRISWHCTQLTSIAVRSRVNLLTFPIPRLNRFRWIVMGEARASDGNQTFGPINRRWTIPELFPLSRVGSGYVLCSNIVNALSLLVEPSLGNKAIGHCNFFSDIVCPVT